MAEMTIQELKKVLADVVDRLDHLTQTPPNYVQAYCLAMISHNAGLISSGEFRSGNNKEPGMGFTGVRMGYPGFTYGAEEWQFAGVENDILQVGIKISDGKLYAGAGDVIVDSVGIFIKNDQDSGLSFGDSNNNRGLIDFKSGLSDELRIRNLVPGGNGGIVFYVKLTEGSTPSTAIREDPGQINRFLIISGQGTQGGGISAGGEAVLFSGGPSGGSTYLGMNGGNGSAMFATPPNPTNNSLVSEGHIYIRNEKIVFQYNDSGTVRYKYLPLTGTSVTWVHSLSAP